ncbi:MAG TPA: hypothetical protein VKA30_08975 [Actinomycetota bacterium]|nr:hypothetical protein [Actinomycetota bacterium]
MYLDLNHWIVLSKARAGHRDGRPQAETLQRCLAAVEDRRAVFPLSDSIYFEVSKIGPYRQRRNLRQVMEELSGFRVIMSRSDISVHEIETNLDQTIGPNPRPINRMEYLDWGVARAFGKVGGFRVKTRSGLDITAEARAAHPGGPAAFDRVLRNAELRLNRQMIEGPSPGEEDQLRALGWNPRAAFTVATRRAQQEIDQVERLNRDPGWRRGRIRDLLAAREMLLEINESLSRGLSERGATLEQLCPTLDDTRRFFDAMPSFDVAVSLKVELHRDPYHRWTPNDVHDIDALGSTVPYCDVVVADKAMAARVRRARLDERLGTAVLSHLADLVEYL